MNLTLTVQELVEQVKQGVFPKDGINQDDLIHLTVIDPTTLTLTAKDLAEHGLFPKKDGIKQGDEICLLVAHRQQPSGEMQRTQMTNLVFVKQDEYGIIVINEKWRRLDIPWKDILEICPTDICP